MEHTESPISKKKSSSVKKVLIRTGLTLVAIVLLIMLAFKISPWPSTLLIRYAFEKGAAKANDGLAKYVPDGIASILNQQYDSKDKDAFLDVYYPSTITNTNQQLPVIVWIHGGGWVSGHKEDISNYCKIL